MKLVRIFAVTSAAIVASAQSASAHVGLTMEGAPKGVTFTVGFAVGHGCDGSPTTTLRTQIPTGIISVQPIAKPGWEIEIVTGQYQTPQQRDGVAVTEGVTEIRWSGGNLPAEWYDEFAIRARIADNVEPGTMIWFPLVQECVQGVNRWITVPVEGQPEPEEPTPGLLVEDAVTPAGHH